MPTVLITGASRGIGLEFARQYAADGWRVIATCRAPDKAEALRAIRPAVALHALDVADLARIAALGRALAGETIDVMIANAGIYIGRAMTPETVEAAPWLESFAVNTIAPLACAGAFLPQVARSSERKMIALGSAAGSLTRIRYGGAYVYRSSKAALHAVWRALAFDHPEIIAALLSPSRARTDMNPTGELPVAESVAGMRRVIAGLTRQDSGGFFRHTGEPAPW
ncbi:MAG TPA: SDR family oxidoreductase [Stellaceae bacterium]|nr:SDR family oxidoreductase [Stellaceae bacterium]